VQFWAYNISLFGLLDRIPPSEGIGFREILQRQVERLAELDSEDELGDDLTKWHGIDETE